MLGSFIDNVVNIGDSLLRVFRADLADYVDLETADDEETLVAKDGSLVTLMEIHGMRSLVGSRTLMLNVVTPLATGLQSAFEDKAHRMQVWFEEDYDAVLAQIEKAQTPARETATRFNMAVGDVLDARAANLARSTSVQRCFIALWTCPAALNKSDQKIEKRQSAEIRKGTPSVFDAQDPLRAMGLLRNRHASFVGLLESKLLDVGVVLNVLDVRTALREVRRSIAPSATDDRWSASLPGDTVYPSLRKRRSSREDWEVIWPPLGWQLCPQDANIVAANAVEVGDRIYAPVYIDLFPRKPQFFNELARSARDKRLPWRASFLIEGGSFDGFAFRRVVSQLISFANRGNKMFKAAMADLDAFTERNGAVVQVRASFCTWAPSHDMPLLEKRSSDLATSLGGWGGCQVSEVTGEPVAGMMSSSLAATVGNIGTKSVAPMTDVLGILPWAQPASPWHTGSMLFKAPSGKLMPYQPISRLQSTWIDLFFAPPGAGKSVLMNASHFALALGPGQPRLPRIAIIDVGPSSSGLISLIQEALPADQRHLVVHRRMQNTANYAINPFETQLGCRFPTALERSFLLNFVTLLVTDIGSSRPDKAMTGLVAAVVDEMYSRGSDMAEAKPYTGGTAHEVDRTLSEMGFKADRHTTWWEVEDALFAAGHVHEAYLAHRFAVPVLRDATAAANSERVRSAYQEVRIEGTSENLISGFNRMIAEALGFFPVLAAPTSFDLGEARIAALDLGDVAKSGGDVADRTTAVMYMLARHALAKDFYLNEEAVPNMPAPSNVALRDSVPAAAYRAYHLRRAKEILEDAKRICFDEFHRTSKTPIVRDQVIVDMREGRKWKVNVQLASQSLADFDDQMVEFATSLYILDGGNETTVDAIASRFGFGDPAEVFHLRHSVRKPRPPTPGVFMAKFDTNMGKFTSLLSLVLSPQEFWAFNTDADNVVLRNELYKRLGPGLARQALSRLYPYGAAAEMQVRRENMRQGGGLLDEGASQSVPLQLAAEVEASIRQNGGI